MLLLRLNSEIGKTCRVYKITCMAKIIYSSILKEIAAIIVWNWLRLEVTLTNNQLSQATNTRNNHVKNNDKEHDQIKRREV
jgi:hypothetical protein